MKKKINYFFLLSIVLGCLHSQDQNEKENFIYESKIEANQNLVQLILEGQIDLIDPKYTLDYISISRLSKDELRLLRNTFYARYGYKFKSQNLTDYYSQYYWYRAELSNVDEQITDTDKRNIRILRGFETIDKNQEKAIDEEDIVGLWHIHFVMPAGWGDVFQFYPDGTFIFRYSQMRQLPLIFSFSGRYRIEGNALILDADEKELLETVDQETTFSGAWGHEWTTWEKTTHQYKEQYIFPLTAISRAEDVVENAPESMINNQVLQFGNLFFFKYSDDPDSYR